MQHIQLLIHSRCAVARAILTTSNMHGFKVVTHPESMYTQTISTAVQAVKKYIITTDSPLSPYSAGKPLDLHVRQYLGKQFDYIFH